MSRNADGLGRKPHKWRGRWRAYLTVGYKPNGDPDRVYVYGATEGECLRKLDQVRRQARHAALDARSLTVDGYLDQWLEEVAPTLAPRTLAIYTSELAHLRPHLGRLRLSQLTPAHVKRAMRAIVGSVVEFGRKGEGGKQTAVLTARAANAARVVLHNALAHAVSEGLIPYNPAAKELVKPLKHAPEEIRVWSAEEVQAFTRATAAGACALHAFFYTALTTGLRVGELGALEWKDVQGTRLVVRRTLGGDGTKTPAGRRVVPLPSDTVSVLAAHRLALATEGVESGLVFPTVNGTPVTRQLARTSLIRWAQRAGVPVLTPHELRHTFASMMIAAGVDPATLARLLGHTSAAFTLRTYVHFFELAQARPALTLTELTGAPEPQGVRVGGTAPKPPAGEGLPN